jgi:NAD(P)-dependent dehydrogenase (short-subunit alcohol dehydrogenase family)
VTWSAPRYDRHPNAAISLDFDAKLRRSPPTGAARAPWKGQIAYTVAKTGLVGLMKQLAVTLAPESIWVNSVHPTGVKSGMTMNEAMMTLAMQAAEGGENAISAMQNAMPIDILEPEDISDAVAFLVSEQAKWITGVALPVDAGFCVR